MDHIYFVLMRDFSSSFLSWIKYKNLKEGRENTCCISNNEVKTVTKTEGKGTGDGSAVQSSCCSSKGLSVVPITHVRCSPHVCAHTHTHIMTYQDRHTHTQTAGLCKNY